jgi:imidazolonepropionase-like amidohydrolase
MSMKTLSLLLFLMSTNLLMGQQIPEVAPPQTKSVLIMNGIAHLGNGQVLENSAIGFENGKFTLVADARTIRLASGAFDTTIDASGMHVYPGFIACNSTLGLAELDQVKQSVDVSETGTFKPGVRSAISYNTDSEITPTIRSNGVLMGQITPRGGVVSGTSSVMQFDAWNWEDAIIREDDGVHVNWPAVYHRHWDKGKISIEKVKSYDQQRTEIVTFFKEASAYCNVKNPAIREVRFEALRGVFAGEKTLYVHADDAKAILEAVNFKQELNIKKMVIVGGYDAIHVASALIENGVPVMLRRVHDLPFYDQDDVDLPFKLPYLLYSKGVKFCLQNAGDMERMGARNLPFYGGTAVAFGLPYEEAVRSLSLSAAEILGISETTGSIESGKDATLFISSGDALDMRTNQLLHAFIQGRKIDLSNKQTELYQKYKKKYDQD